MVDRIVVLDRGTVAGQFMKNELTLEQLIDRLYLVAKTGDLDVEEAQHEHGSQG